jgi:hypothetical protein
LFSITARDGGITIDNGLFEINRTGLTSANVKPVLFLLISIVTASSASVSEFPESNSCCCGDVE